MASSINQIFWYDTRQPLLKMQTLFCAWQFCKTSMGYSVAITLWYFWKDEIQKCRKEALSRKFSSRHTINSLTYNERLKDQAKGDIVDSSHWRTWFPGMSKRSHKARPKASSRSIPAETLISEKKLQTSHGIGCEITALGNAAQLWLTCQSCPCLVEKKDVQTWWCWAANHDALFVCLEFLQHSGRLYTESRRVLCLQWSCGLATPKDCTVMHYCLAATLSTSGVHDIWLSKFNISISVSRQIQHS